MLSARRGDGTYVQQSTSPAEWLQEAMVPLAGLIESDPHYRLTLERATRWNQHRLAGCTARHGARTKPTSSAVLR